MAKKEKHGITVRGNTTTFHGNSARLFMATRWMDHCFDNQKASSYINKQEPGDYKDALISVAKNLGMVEDAKAKGRVKAIRKKKVAR